MSLLRFIIPVAIIGGGAVLVFNEAKASEKKKRIEKAYDLGLDDVEVEDDGNPPLPPAMSRAYSNNPINHETFNGWWFETDWAKNGVMGFWLPENMPAAGTDWLLPGINYPDAVVVTSDGAFWYFDDGWHPAPLLAQDYDSWFDSGAT